MRILVLTSQLSQYSNKIAINRFSIYAQEIYNCFKKIEDVEVFLDFYPNSRFISKDIIQKIEYPQVDFSILVREEGFDNLSPYLLEKLKKVTTIKVCSFSSSNIFKSGENLMFYIYSQIWRENTIQVGLFLDTQNCYSQQSLHELNIMLNFSEDEIHTQSFINNLKKNGISNFNIKMLNKNRFYLYNEYNRDWADLYPDEEIGFEKIYREWSMTHIYITDRTEDYLKLLELAASDVVIVAKRDTQESFIMDFIDIYLFENLEEISWSTLKEISYSMKSNNRKKFIDKNMTLSKIIQNIYCLFQYLKPV